MGVAGLWDVLKPAAKTRSLTELAVSEGFQANPRGLRGYRIGIDASIWFFHAEYGKEGENPVLRTLFFRCATLMKAPFLPLFVFDGPKRPDFKRGKRINKTGNKLIPGMKRIVEAFGFEWRTAPGEAEAELAYLNRIGVIDGILSDDVDTFLFGSITVIRNQSNNLSGNKANPILNSEGRDDKNHTRVFRFQDIHDHPEIQLTRGGLILIGLMSGGDYEGGLERCGIATAHALARCGFGDSLYEAARHLSREDLVAFLDGWREEFRHELKTNSKGLMGRKAVSLSKSVTDTFPNIDVLLSYIKPVTSESLGHEGANPKITWSKEPNVAALASACELFFEWGYKDAIVKRFRTVIWPGVVLRILRRAVLNVVSIPALPSTPDKSNRKTDDNEDGYGTPSKMIAKHFSTINLNSDKEPNPKEYEESRLIVSISQERTHASTDGLPEYRLQVSPGQLVDIAVSGLQGLRQPEGPNEWASDEDEDEDDDGRGRAKTRKPKEPIDPKSHLRLWMPTCMVDPVEKGLVRSFREAQERKKQKKRAPPKKKAASKQEREDASSPPKIKSKGASTISRPALQPVPQPKVHAKDLSVTPPRLTSRPFPADFLAMRQEEEESSGDEGELPTWVIPAQDEGPALPRSTLNKPSTNTVPLATKSTSSRAIATSRTAKVAEVFKPSSSATPSSSLRHVEATLALSGSEDELPMDVYQTIRPRELVKPTASNKIPGYMTLSDLSDNDNYHAKPAARCKRKNPSGTKALEIQTTLSAYAGKNRPKKTDSTERQDFISQNQSIQKSPRKSKSHVSPRHKQYSSQTKEVITISDDDIDLGYTGITKPSITPLQLARSRVKGKSVSARSGPPIPEVLELTDDEI